MLWFGMQVFDLKHMVVKTSEENKQYLVDIFQIVGEEVCDSL